MSEEVEKIPFTVSSGNVFADLGLPDAEERFEKAKLVFSILHTAKERGMKRTETASLLDIRPSQISDLSHGRWDDFPLERLIRLSRLMGNEVKIVIQTSGIDSIEEEAVAATVR